MTIDSMSRGHSLLLLLGTCTLLAAAPAKHPADPPPGSAQKLVQTCDAHKFETSVETTVNGEPHRSTVKLCGVHGQSDADWVRTLRDAERKLSANQEMAPELRDKLTAAISAEIGRLNALAAAAPIKAPNPGLTGGITFSAPKTDEFARLPPLPQPVEPARPVPPPPSALQEGYSTLPPLPPPINASQPKAARIIPAAPTLKFACLTPGDLAGAGPCTDFGRDTVLTISAAQDVPAGIALEFVRDGHPQADVDLGGLKRAHGLQVAVPRQICAGFGAGRLDLHVVSKAGGEVLNSDGPYVLRC
jgi:hypothetical protein